MTDPKTSGVKGFLQKMFPFIATAAAAFGGPVGNMAANALGTALGANKQDPNMDDLALAAAKATPEQIIAAQQAEKDFALKMQQLGYQYVEDLEKTFAGDRDSARKREIAVRDNTPKILAYIVVATVFFLEGYGLLHGFSKFVDPVILGRVLGTLDSAAILVLGYYYGSSIGSSTKDATIGDAIRNGK